MMTATGPPAPPIVRVAFLDVGQADTIVVSSPDTGEAVVIDCVDADAVLRYLEHEGIRHLRAIVITHLHADHYRGVPLLLKNMHHVSDMSACEVVVFNDILDRVRREVLLRDDDRHSTVQEGDVDNLPSPMRSVAYRGLLAWRAANKGRYQELKAPTRHMPLDGQLARAIEVLHPFAADYVALEGTGLNNTSIVLRINGPGSSALLTGDLEPSGWFQLVANHAQPDAFRCDVLKFPHHGAWKDADVMALLDGIQPSVIVISVGTDGERYNHPHAQVFAAVRDRARQYPIRLLCTQATSRCGSVVTATRQAVVAAYDAMQIGSAFPRLLARNGCPCAGTVQVELGSQVQVLQPDPDFHRADIVLAHYSSHQCPV